MGNCSSKVGDAPAVEKGSKQVEKAAETEEAKKAEAVVEAAGTYDYTGTTVVVVVIRVFEYDTRTSMIFTGSYVALETLLETATWPTYGIQKLQG